MSSSSTYTNTKPQLPTREYIESRGAIYISLHSLPICSVEMASEPGYTVFIRLPFPRGDFVDPPPVSHQSAAEAIQPIAGFTNDMLYGLTVGNSGEMEYLQRRGAVEYYLSRKS